MAYQHGELVEGQVEAKPLQAERYHVLNIGQYATAALHVEDQRVLFDDVSICSYPRKELDKCRLSDSGRTVNQHDAHCVFVTLVLRN